MDDSYPSTAPAKTLSSLDAVAIIVGVVIGAGIFKTPSLVAVHAGSEVMTLLLWAAGGLLSFVGALCYAELSSAYPDTGGDYFFIRRAFGANPAFLFAWARMSVIQTGSLAMLAFIIGDYASQVFRIGEWSSSWYAGLVIVLLTSVNAAGIRQGKAVQNVLTGGIVLGLAAVICIGLAMAWRPVESAQAGFTPIPGKALIFVLLTYGGWNESAYITAELEQERSMTRVLFSSIAIITLIYVAANIAFLKGLGLAGTAGSEAVAADLMRTAVGEGGARFISALVVLAVLSTMNAVMITGARTNYALGRDFSLLSVLGVWRKRTNAPVNALLLQCGISLALIGLGSVNRNGFSTMVEYTAPVFWLFFLLVGVALFVLRRKEPGRLRPFRVPFYPLTPLVFCLFCAYMFQSSFTYAGAGALTGAAVLATGLPVLYAAARRERSMHGGQH